MQPKKEYLKKDYDTQGATWDGMKIQLTEFPRNEKVIETFQFVPDITVEEICGVLFIRYKDVFIADITGDVTKEGKFLTLNPGIYNHINLAVFKTYNRLLKLYAPGFYLKFNKKQWIMCKEK